MFGSGLSFTLRTNKTQASSLGFLSGCEYSGPNLKSQYRGLPMPEQKSVLYYKEFSEPSNPSSNLSLRKGELKGIHIDSQTGNLVLVVNNKYVRIKDCLWFGRKIVVNHKQASFPSLSKSVKLNQEYNQTIDRKEWGFLKTISPPDFILMPEENSNLYVYSLRNKTITEIKCLTASYERDCLVVLNETEEYRIDLKINQVFSSKQAIAVL